MFRRIIRYFRGPKGHELLDDLENILEHVAIAAADRNAVVANRLRELESEAATLAGVLSRVTSAR